MPWAHIEHVSSFIRLFEDGKEYKKDPFTWAAGLKWINPQTVEICIATKKLTRPEWKAICKALQDIGVETIVFIRVRKDREQIKTIDLRVK